MRDCAYMCRSGPVRVEAFARSTGDGTGFVVVGREMVVCGSIAGGGLDGVDYHSRGFEVDIVRGTPAAVGLSCDWNPCERSWFTACGQCA